MQPDALYLHLINVTTLHPGGLTMFRDIFIVMTGKEVLLVAFDGQRSRMQPQMSVVPRLREPPLRQAGRTVFCV